jgi:hypothetical protein
VSDIDAFITRWKSVGGNELANYQLFLTELAAVLGLPHPEPATGDPRSDAYVFERSVKFVHGDGSESAGRIDLYRRGAFVLEAKKVRPGAKFDDALLRARGQAESYARSLPADEGRPPFVVVVDVGTVIQLYSDFTRSGATYIPFPDTRSHQIRIDQLGDEAVRERLRKVWLDPMSLDPSRQAARVTRIIAGQLADIAVQLEDAGHPAEAVAGFLTRCLFTFFAEDVELIPKRSFATLLDGLIREPAHFVPMVQDLWTAMDRGGLSIALKTTVPHFNGKLFKDQTVLPLNRAQIELLRKAANADWQFVEPAIFGTLLERALDPTERHALGAHYTPRAYVERLVLPTIVEPLREEWRHVQTAALTLAAEGKDKEARAEVRAFLQKLCSVRVLDPACGSGNFLYVTLEHLKRLEGEVLLQLESLGVSMTLEATGFTVDPHQFLGIEINPRAAAIAELVLWIGYLQWHFRTRGHVLPSQPVLRNFKNIENRDAVLAYDRVEPLLDDHGQPVTRWDGVTMKTHPVTGEQVPDDAARVQVERYINPRPAEWPAADFVIGNPPFIGNKRMRIALGDGYVESLRAAWPEVAETSDLVMYWWHKAASLTQEGHLRAFGLITTNSLRQTFNRQVTELHTTSKHPLRLRFVIPDHPWVDSADGAAVRIAMSVGDMRDADGLLREVISETEGEEGEVLVELSGRTGLIHPDLTAGANVSAAVRLQANAGVCFQGMNLVGKGFRVTAEDVREMGYDVDVLPDVIKPHFNARDFMQGGEPIYVIDLFGFTADDARSAHPALYQRLFDRVKPERDHNNRPSYRDKWWVFGEARGKLRRSWQGLSRIILTPETSKHRVFAFVDLPFCPDHKLYAVCGADAMVLGVLSARPHRTWALTAGGRLGVGNDPTWTNTTCFLTFPFPAANHVQAERIRDLAEQLDAHRKRQQAAFPELTLTGMYNVQEKLRTGEALTDKERVIHEQGLVSVLRQLHDELDEAVLESYGWEDLRPLMRATNGHRDGSELALADARAALDEQLLERLVALNAERAAEEARGLVRWLRPEFQNPAGHTAPTQADLETGDDDAPVEKAVVTRKQPWPKDLTDQVKAVTAALASTSTPRRADDIAALFTGGTKRPARVAQILEMLTALGRARATADGRFAGE